MGDVPSQAGQSGPRSKVARLLEEYGLEGLGTEMAALWTAEGPERKSLRDLAQYFNEQVLERTMDDAGIAHLDGEVENVYRLLTDEETSGGDRTRTVRRLERDGVDVESLRDDFVTYQAIRTYLHDYQEAEYPQDDRDRVDVERSNVQRLRGRTERVTESKLESLRDQDHLGLGSFRTFVEISVLCEDCGTRTDVETLLERGGCECER